MVAMLIVPMIALIIMSFWTQTVLEIDRTFTLENYWHLIEPAGDEPIPTWMGIPFPLKRAVISILLLKSILMSLVGHRRGHPARLSDGLFPRLPGQAPQDASG